MPVGLTPSAVPTKPSGNPLLLKSKPGFEPGFFLAKTAPAARKCDDSATVEMIRMAVRD